MFVESMVVPFELRHEAFVATPLTQDLAAWDFAAYMASPDVIRVHSGGRWPFEGFTVEEDRRLIAEHEADYEARRAFALLLLDPSESEALGCLYLNSLHDYLRAVRADGQTRAAFPPESAMVSFWIRQDHLGTTLPAVVLEAVNDWLLGDWPLKAHVFRLVPAEHVSGSALERLALRRLRLALPGEDRHYLWYQPR